MLAPLTSFSFTFIMALLAMAFFTLLERKILGYIQLRKGPNKVSISGVPQPMADALKLFLKEHPLPSMANPSTFFMSPMIALLLSLLTWMLYPFSCPSTLFPLGALFLLALSSLNVYTTLGAGWSSNSKYALLGALRSVAQTISYEVSMVLILLSPLTLSLSLSLTHLPTLNPMPPSLILPPLLAAWFISTLAETNRTPFDFAEGESELVSGFNTEYSSGSFALIFMAEYMNIIIMSMMTTVFFLSSCPPLLEDPIKSLSTLLLSLLFLWLRGTLPRMRYDHLMYLTWKTFLLLSISSLLLCISLTAMPYTDIYTYFILLMDTLNDLLSAIRPFLGPSPSTSFSPFL